MFLVVVFLCFLQALAVTGCNSTVPSPYIPFFMDNWTKLARAEGLLESYETLFPVAYEGSPTPWYYSMQYTAIDSLKNSHHAPCGPNTGAQQRDRYGWLFNQFSTAGSSPEALNCFNAALSARDKFENRTTPLPPYYLSLHDVDWLRGYDQGLYRKDIAWSGPMGNKGWKTTFTADSMVRVDIEPREWYTNSFPWLIRNSRTPEVGGVCAGQRIQDCFFSPAGYLNQWTTGMIVTSNCQTHQFLGPGLNSTITCKADTPQIAAWVVKPLPVRDAFCPCAGPRPGTQYCTSPGKI